MLSDAEQKILDQASLEEPWGLIEAFSKLMREHPDDVNKAMEMVGDRLRRYGVPVKMHEPNLYLSLPGKARVEASGKSFRAKPPAYCVNPSGGFTGKLVYIASNKGDGFDKTFSKDSDDGSATSKIAGSIVLSEGYASPSLVSAFEALGAAGVIAINPGVDIHWGICTTIWGTPDLEDLPRKPKIPAVAVNKPDGEALIAMAKSGAEVTIFADMEEGWYRSKLPDVMIPGTDGSDQYVLLHGHLDSWDVGVGDNAVGDATMLEIARVLWANKDKLKRGVRIVWWPGHSTGRYAGSTWFSDAFAIDLDENCVAQVNCDSPGCRWATQFTSLSCMPETHAFITEAIQDVCGKDMIVEPERAHQAGDYSFNNIGITGYYMLSSTMADDLRAEKGYYAVGGCGGNIAWHTENDVMEIADKDNLLRDIKVYLLSVFRNANAPILPFDWRLAADEFVGTVASYQQKAGDRFDLTPARSAADDLRDAIARFYTDVEAGKTPPEKANKVIMDLARILIPINFTREARFRHDPALTTPPLPTLSAAADLDNHANGTLGFALTSLMRGQNRVVSAFRQAKRHIELVTA
jgi:N-acetylated-alpha-linked acidic dipeptidase